MIRLHNSSLVLSALHPRSVRLFTRDGRRYKLQASSGLQRNLWVAVLKANASYEPQKSANEFGSFVAPIVDPVLGRFFVDGEDYYSTLLGVLKAATTEILITDWSFQPELYLNRGPDASPSDRLDRVLHAKAREGVKVHILIWWQTAVGTVAFFFLQVPLCVFSLLSLFPPSIQGGSVNSAHVADAFADEPNISVMRHPRSNLVSPWTHHQKSVVVDRVVSFVGGIDLCYGRWDNKVHRLADNVHTRLRWPGKDYYNPCARDQNSLEMPFADLLDRDTETRMPWHDNQVCLVGEAAVQVARSLVCGGEGLSMNISLSWVAISSSAGIRTCPL